MKVITDVEKEIIRQIVRPIRRIVVHCSAGNARWTAAQIADYHCQRLGWSLPGYHYVVEASGRIVEICAPEKRANGARGFNVDSIHVCYTGGVAAGVHPKDTRTAAQRDSLRRLVGRLKRVYGVEAVGHRDLSPDRNGNGRLEPSEWIKACPCFDARAEYSGS